MKKFFVLMIAWASACCFADVPSWLKNPEKVYPTTEYIRAIGEGTNAKAAQNAAIADISLYFDTKTDVVTLAVKKTAQVVVDDKSFFENNQSLTQATTVSSNAEFFCVKFTEPWYDKKAGKYSVLGYINKKEAAQIYTARINALMDAINSYRAYAKKEKEPFLGMLALHKATVISSLAEKYIHNEMIIYPSESAKFQKDLTTIALLPAEQNELKKQVTFVISMNQKEKRFDPVFSTVASILEKRGYALSVSGANHRIIIDVSCAEEKYDAGEFVRPSVDVLILNAAGEGLYTYSKAHPRTGGKTLDQAYTRAISKVTQDLEENFLAE